MANIYNDSFVYGMSFITCDHLFIVNFTLSQQLSPDNKKSRPNDEVDNNGTEYLQKNMKQNDSEPGPETEYEGGAEEFSEDLHYDNVEEDYTDNYGYDDDFF